MLTYPIHTRILEDFLGQYFTDIYIGLAHTVFKNGKLHTEVPHLKMLSKKEVVIILKDAKLSLTEFEEYYQHLEAMDVFNKLIDLSGRTLKE